MYTSLHLLPPLGEDRQRNDTVPGIGWYGNIFYGDKVRGAGWYGHTTGLHTVAIRVLNFQGRVKVQATIALDPMDTDWYSVLPGSVESIQYPQPNYFVQQPNSGETSIFGFNFSTNAVWIRAIVDQNYLIPSIATPPQIMAYGTVDYVLATY